MNKIEELKRLVTITQVALDFEGVPDYTKIHGADKNDFFDDYGFEVSELENFTGWDAKDMTRLVLEKIKELDSSKYKETE